MHTLRRLKHEPTRDPNPHRKVSLEVSVGWHLPFTQVSAGLQRPSSNKQPRRKTRGESQSLSAPWAAALLAPESSGCMTLGACFGASTLGIWKPGHSPPARVGGRE